MNKHLLLQSIACCQEVQEPSNAKLINLRTKVPRYIVIISASGDLESPKSATFATHFPLSIVTKTLSDFKSR